MDIDRNTHTVTDHDEILAYVREYFTSAAAEQAERGMAFETVTVEEEDWFAGFLVCTDREWDWYMTRLYARLAYSLHRRHGIRLAPYPITRRVGREVKLYVEVKQED